MPEEPTPQEPTPPATNDWRGEERRRSVPAAEEATRHLIEILNGSDQKKRAWDDPTFMAVIIASLTALALMVLVLTSQFRLASSIRNEEDRAREFRRAVTCFMVETGQAEEGRRALSPDLLTRCGFIDAPGTRR